MHSTNRNDGPEADDKEMVGKQVLLERLFPDERDRPSTRWLDMQCAKGLVPFVRFGRLIWFNVPQVRAAFMARTIAPRGRRAVVIG